MIKLIASDMDGTLLNNRHEIDDETVEAIKKAEEIIESYLQFQQEENMTMLNLSSRNII